MKHIQLQEQLCQFGLNPKDWIVQQISAHSYAVRHRKDQETYFRGLAIKTAQTLKWKKLQLAI